MQDPAFAAVHGIKAERLLRGLHAFGGLRGARPQFLDAEQPVVIRIEADAAVILGRYVKRFHGEVFERQQYFVFVGQQLGNVLAVELHADIGVLKLRVDRLVFHHLVADIEAHERQHFL